MIKIDSEHYYSCDEASISQKIASQQMQKIPKKSEPVLQVVGNVKQFLSELSIKIKSIQNLRQKQRDQQLANRLILDQLNTIDFNKKQLSQEPSAQFQIAVPQSIYLLEERLSKIEEKFNNNQIFRQKVQRKGKLAERIKFLHTKIQTLSSKSPDILISNLNNYYQNLDQKDENMKTLFLYEASSNTKGLTEQIEVLTTYLKNLNNLQSKLKSMPSKDRLVEDHCKILEKRKQTNKKIQLLYTHMKSEYQKVIKEIDSI